MPGITNASIEVRFRTVQTVRDRLAHHAKRIGKDMNDIVRDGLLAHLDKLDEKELHAISEREARAKRGAAVPVVNESRFGKAPGLGLRRTIFSASVAATRIPAKVVNSFRKYAEYLEAASDKIDGNVRAQHVIDDLQDRCASAEEVDAAHDALMDFMKGRSEARHKPLDVIAVDARVPLHGDV